MAGMMDHKKVLIQLSDLLLREENCVAQIYSDTGVADDKNELLEIARAKTGEEFRVLIIGAFSSGKSSMINALIGEDLLPTGFLPETAVLGELHYGEKRITLYPKKGQWEGGDDPFDLADTTAEEIARYASLSSDDALNSMAEDSERRIESKFEKMVIHWPLEMLKDGVVLVDSPGINDPYSSDYIVNDYLPRADAIVYVMDATKAYTGTDKTQLTSINDIGLKNIITGYTFYDVIVGRVRKPEELAKVRNQLIAYMSKHSDLGVPAIHFLDSMSGMEAKLEKDAEKLKSSGYAGLEEYLTQYLVEGKGKDQVRNMASTIVKQADAFSKDANKYNAAALQDVDALKERAKQAQFSLDTVRNNSYNTGRTYKMRLEAYLPKIRTMAAEFLSSLPEKVDLEDYTPETQLPDGVSKLNPLETKRRAKALQEECQTEMERRMNIKYRQWANNDLDEYLKTAIQEATKDIDANLKQISGELSDITDMVAGTTASKAGEAIGNVAIGVAYAILTGDWFTGGMSVVYGKGAMARGMAFQAATGVGLGLLMLAGAPIGLPVVVIASIGASIAAIITSNNDKKVDKIKTQAVSDVRKAYKDPQSKETVEKQVAGVMKNVEAYFEHASSAMQEALKEDIKATEDSIQQMIDEATLSKEEKETQIAKRNEATECLAGIKQEALEFCQQYGITEL